MSTPEKSPAMTRLEETRTAHTAQMMKINDITAAITRSKKEREAAIENGKEAETNWRTRFRSLRGNLTDELRAQHSQRIVSRELAEEFTGLIEELEFEHEGEMIRAVHTGHAYVNAHNAAFTQYVEGQWEAAMRNLSPTLVRAVRLKLLSLRLNDRGRHTDRHHEEPEVILAREVGKVLADKAEAARLDMDAEPVVSEMGVYRPALTGVDMKLYNSPASIHKLVYERKEKLEKQQKESQA
ncbi:hypothetical protein [Erwinia sp. 198]|uniref:hypothetical protein n=1 Tax=Erwinia sp. 198 TaxID=2022746 RepID=UPI000F67552F|nr:hypothetical protein [Erwinia sp. 198]RRZ92325.1 hypothetical protein EGK14_11040 [Erwinia sp. 198]